MKEIDIHDINPASYNPRKISEHAYNGLKNSMDKFGDISGITWNNRTKNLIAGHQRWNKIQNDYHDISLEHSHDDKYKIVSRSKGYIGYDIRIVDWDLSTEKAANVTANNHAIGGEWEVETLKELMIEIKDFSDSIFDELNLSDLSDSLDFNFEDDKSSKDLIGDENHIPDSPKNITTKSGDVWILGGRHRLKCGNSTSEDDVKSLMGSNRAQIAFTSPPYNAGDEVEIGSKGHKYESHNDAMNGNEYFNLLCKFTKNTLEYCDLSIVNIQQLSGNKIAFVNYLNEFKTKLVDICIWNKEFGTPCLPKRVMNSAFEYVLFFSNENLPPKTIKTAPMFHGNINNVYSGPKQTKNEFSEIHRATFPLHLPEYFISKFSTGDVIELFNGTGTTLVACEKLGRRCFAMDMDPLYIDVTVERWMSLTGSSDVILERDGKKYNDIKK